VSVPPAVFAATLGLAWVAENIIAVAATSAACGILAFAAVVALMRWTGRREARFAESGPLLHARCEVINGSQPQSAVGQAGQPAIAPAVISLNFYGVPADERAAIIRNAITEGN
jgi:hypothetical protein